MAQSRALAVSLRPLQDAAAEITTPEIERLDQQVAEPGKRSMPPILRTGPSISNRKSRMPRCSRAALVKPRYLPATVEEMDRLNSQIAGLDKIIKALPKPQWVYAAANYFEPQGTFRFAIKPRPVTVLARGSVESPGAALNQERCPAYPA